MTLSQRMHRRAAMIGLALLCGASFIGAERAAAQSNTYGTDQRYCDHSAISQILSTSTGNLVGSAAGAAAGGLIGSQFGKSSGNTLATIVGVLGGAVGGGYVGRSMDPTDRACAGQSLEHAPANQPVAWQNPSSGSSYWVTPVRDLRGQNDELCRNYITDGVVNNVRQRAQNTACQQPDGNWRPVAKNYARAVPVSAPAQTGGDASAVSTDTIIKVQQRLHDLGFYVRDNIDGQWGPRTATALQNFQRSKRLEPSGQLNPETLAALGVR
jgi:surface antigen